MHDTTILAIPGSLRAGSVNRRLVEAAAVLTPAGTTIETYTGLDDLPHYDADRDGDSPPSAVVELRERIRNADGLLVVTPEYNGGIPGVLKNALDWASTPHRSSALTDKPVAVMGATPGRSGTAAAQAHLRQVLARIGSEVVDGPEIAVAQAFERFDEQGQLSDEVLAGSITALLDVLVRHSSRRALLSAAC